MMPTSQFKLIFYSAIFFVIAHNIAFFKTLLQSYPLSIQNLGFLISIVITLLSFIILFFTILSSKYSTKAILILLLIASSFSSYFMNSYHIVIDEDMLQNILETNFQESLDLFSINMLLYVLLLGILPAYLVLKAPITYASFTTESWSKIKVIAIIAVILTSMFFGFSKAYTSFVREHKPIRYYINPLYYLFSTGKYLANLSKVNSQPLKIIGAQATIPSNANRKPKLIIFVLGETARADRFSLNGYQRNTNAYLSTEKVTSFTNMQSCGTSTASSVPCLFSILGREQYDKETALNTENVLDVLQHAGVKVLWRDNNSDSKGVALRVPYVDYKTDVTNTICNPECRDEGMLVGLQAHINANSNQDILIVLHQMGSHGPAYYKRYPNQFEIFTPVCKTNQLEACNTAEINNSYDNTIAYTDYFLSKVIKLLKANDSSFATGLFYMSDHGESLGEQGIYLHGLPYFMAPKAQTHVASLLWFGEQFKINHAALQQRANQQYSHDYVFHTLLGLMDVKTTVYQAELNLLHGLNATNSSND